MDTQTPDSEVHTFDNGIKVFRNQLLKQQLERYQKHNLHEPEEEFHFLEAFKSITKPNGIYINIGAAIGYYALLAKRLCPDIEVHAFEPLEMHRHYFLKNMELNAISPQEIHLYEQAISSKSGETQFFQHDYSSCLVEETYLKLRDLPDKLKTSVKSITLDNFINTLSGDVDLVQMDVQGFEYDVLAGAEETLKSHKVRRWMVGTHTSQLHAACMHFFQKNNYRITVDQFETKHQPDGILIAEY